MIWQAELQTAFPGMSIGLDPLPISISCRTGDGALGVGIHDFLQYRADAERFGGKAPAEYRADEALASDSPEQYPIPASKRIQKRKAAYAA
ncbi:MAG: hypothetical protein SOW84_00885 [Candidatus Faecousia sp.]|nr:hypothetical protein [Candidatus Faecousia sp.]